jgi:non-heme Fe2+,alpha-ketoglutarate-dependent halogenase
MSRHYSLSQDELAAFERDGFVGPFPTDLTSELIGNLREFFEEMATHQPAHPLYGRFSVRDWHLVDSRVGRMFTSPSIVDRLISIAGEDLVLWRSKLFHKRPGEAELGWHQEWGQFNGEEIGNDKPSLIPARTDHWWNLTVWVALDDMTRENGALQFIRGSHKRRYPIEMVPMTGSAFFHDPFIGIDDPLMIADLASRSRLILDMDTAQIFEGVDTSTLTLDAARNAVANWLAQRKAAVTLPFKHDPRDLVTIFARAGDFVIFTERTMHGSLPNTTQRSRVAVNCRVTTTDSLIYPGRLRGDFIDGSNLNISGHECVLLSGKDLCGQNVYRDNAQWWPNALADDNPRADLAKGSH